MGCTAQARNLRATVSPSCSCPGFLHPPDKHSLHVYQSWLPVTFHLWLRECSPLSLASCWLDCSAFYITTLAYHIFKRKRGVPVILVEGLPWLSHNMVETPYWSLVWGCLKAHSRNRQLLRVCTWNTHSPPLHPHLTLVLNPCSLDVVLFYRTTETLGGGTWLVEVGHRDGPVRIMSSWVPVGLSASCLLWCEQPLHVFPLP